MFLTLDGFFNDEPSIAISVDSSGIDVSDFQDEEDQSFLITHGHELMRIDAKAEHAKEQICKAIDARAEDAKGKLIYEIQERFNKTPELKGGLHRYFHSLGYWNRSMENMGLVKPEKSTSLTAAFQWANCYRAALEMQEKLKGTLTPEEIQSKASSLPASALAKIYTSCSEVDREKIYERVGNGEVISKEEALEIAKNPKIKLSRAEELLAAARVRKELAEQRWEQVKADPNLNYQSDEYKDASVQNRVQADSVENWEAKVADLQKQVEATEAELMKFKHDTDYARQERIKVLTDALTVGVPQATADLNKYIRDAEYYPADVRRHMDDQIKVLADMCGDYLSRI